MRLSPPFVVFTVVGAILATALFAAGTGRHEHDASASVPLVDGKIVFDRSSGGVYDVWVMGADGSNQTNLTTDQTEDAYYAVWSPDGTKIAYEVNVYEDNSDYDIWVMNADGSGKVGIAQAETLEGGPAWSPDGTKIAFHDGDDVWVMDANGANKEKLTTDPAFDCCATWSPDGTQIVFESDRSGLRVPWIMNADGGNQLMVPGSQGDDSGYEFSPDGNQYALDNSGDIYTMNVDGSNRQQVTDNDMNEYSATWSADGTRIIFTRVIAGVGQIISVNPDGTNAVNLSNSASYDSYPDAQGLPAGTGLLWGDSDCSGAIGARDNQALLRNVLDQPPLSQTEPCPDVGEEFNLGDGTYVWGDWDCSGAIGARDNQALLRFVLDQPPLSQTEPCPDIGSSPL